MFLNVQNSAQSQQIFLGDMSNERRLRGAQNDILRHGVIAGTNV